MHKQPIEYLRHISEECNFILTSIPSQKTRADFFSDETLKRAIVRSLEVIGEATKNIPYDFKMKWTFIDWKKMAGMRDRLIHDYMGINYFIVWDVVRNKIPELSKQVREIIDYEEKE